MNKKHLLICGFILSATIFLFAKDEDFDPANAPSYSELNFGFKLAPELEQRIVKAPTPRKILYIHRIDTDVIFVDPFKLPHNGYIFLGISLELRGDFKFEGIWHGTLYFARKLSEPDWSKAIEFRLPEGVEFKDLRGFSYKKLDDFLKENKT